MDPQFVLDASVSLAWCFEDEQDEYAEAILECLQTTRAVAPEIWSLEVANVLLVAERKKRIDAAQLRRFTTIIRRLPIEVQQLESSQVFSDVLALAKAESLSVYDAAYLDLAMRRGLPLATLDRPLRLAAKHCNVAAFAPSV